MGCVIFGFILCSHNHSKCSPYRLQTALKKANTPVASDSEDDRSKSIMIFGLPGTSWLKRVLELKGRDGNVLMVVLFTVPV